MSVLRQDMNLFTTVYSVFSTGHSHGAQYREDVRGRQEPESSAASEGPRPSSPPLFLDMFRSLHLNMYLEAILWEAV